MNEKQKAAVQNNKGLLAKKIEYEIFVQEAILHGLLNEHNKVVIEKKYLLSDGRNLGVLTRLWTITDKDPWNFLIDYLNDHECTRVAQVLIEESDSKVNTIFI